MDVKTQRSYHSPHRQEQANATRRRILEAAEGLFGDRGYAGVTMEAIARAAGVSLATVYLYFSGKAPLLAALADEIVAAPELSVERVERATDPVEQLQIGVGIVRELNQRSWQVVDVLRSAQGGEKELNRTWELWQERHLEAIRRGIAAVHAGGGLRPGLRVEEAIDMFYALAGPDVYRALVSERDWDPDHYERWLFRLSCSELLGTATKPSE